jgi:hypothetical protein
MLARCQKGSAMFDIIINVLIAVLIVFSGCGCEDVEDFDEPEFYMMKAVFIDESCSDEVVNMTYDAIDDINDLANDYLGQHILVFSGTRHVEHSTSNVPRKTIACYDNEPVWFADSHYAETGFGGVSVRGHIKLFFFRTHESLYFALIKHELMHYIGINGHTDVAGSVMHRKVMQEDFTQEDIDMFLDVYDKQGVR